MMTMTHEDRVEEEQIRARADEAEAGYDVESLRRLGRWRPGAWC